MVLGIKSVPVNAIINQKYDVVVSDICNDLVINATRLFKPKYVLFFLNQNGFSNPNYFQFNDLSWQKTEETTTKQIIQKELKIEQIKNIIQQKQIQQIKPTQIKIEEIKYNKYHINYLHEVQPGKVSIIMIVSKAKNNFADVINNIKQQEFPKIQYIVIDNAAGYRNNIKPDIRYGKKMPIDFCQYHAKELCSGEYMIILDENSEKINILDAIANKKYEVR